MSGGASCIMAQQDMVKKIYFPREVLPISYVTSQFINMLLSFIVIFIVLIVARYKLNPIAILCLPIVMVVEYVLALGLTMIMCALTVYLRDLEYVLGILTLAWQFLTPVMYSINMAPKEVRWVFSFNPMSYVIVAYRDILYYGKVPRLENLLSAIIIGIAALVIGWIVFERLQKHFVEEL